MQHAHAEVAAVCADARTRTRHQLLATSLSSAVVGCVLLVGVAASAQGQQPTAPSDTQSATQHPPHRFFDSVNLALTGVQVGALVADGITTQRALNRCPTSCWEADPFARPFVDAGWTGQIVGGTLFVASEVGLRFLLHRKGHHQWERLLPFGVITYETTNAIHNARLPH
jgi:hypothetical protein